MTRVDTRLLFFLIFLGMSVAVVIQFGLLLNNTGFNSWESGIDLWMSGCSSGFTDLCRLCDRPFSTVAWFVFSVVLTICPCTRRIGIVAVLALIAEFALVEGVVKLLVNRPRPFEVMGVAPLLSTYGSSYPSGHTCMAFLFAGLLFTRWRRASMVFVPVGVFVAITRLATCVHYLSDVIVGSLFGFIVGFLFYAYFEGYLSPSLDGNVITPDSDSRVMVSIDKKTRQLFDEHKATFKIYAMATASKNGVPNVVPIGFLWIDGDEVFVVDNYLNKTLANIRENPVVAVYAQGGEGGHECVQIKGVAKYETSGPAYEAAVVKAHAVNPAFPAKGLVRITVTDAYDTTPGPKAGSKIY